MANHEKWRPTEEEEAQWERERGAKRTEALRLRAERMVLGIAVDKARLDSIAQQNALSEAGIRSTLYSKIEWDDSMKKQQPWDKISWELAVAPERRVEAQAIIAKLR